MSAASQLQDRPLAEIHPFEPQVLEEPYAYYQKLRREAPVYRDPHTDLVFVSSHERILEVLRQPECFSSQFGAGLGGGQAANPELREIMAEGYPAVDTMLTADPPEHGRFRGLVNKAFTPRRVRGMAEDMEQIADALIDAFVTRGSFEAVTDYAVLLPLTVIAKQLGVSTEDLPKFRRWTDGFVTQLSGLAGHEDGLEAARRIVEFQKYFAEKLEEARLEDREDIISTLVHARIEGERPLDVAESLSILQQLLVAGHETTASSIAEGLLLLVQHPEQLALVLEDRSRISNCVEEVLRLATPTQNMWRVVVDDCELGGVELKARSFLMLRFGAANRDESVFAEPERFDVLRENASEQIAFGHGIHFCIAAMLARQEMQVAFERLFDRVAGLRLAPHFEPRHKPHMLLRCLTELPLEFDVKGMS